MTDLDLTEAIGAGANALLDLGADADARRRIVAVVAAAAPIIAAEVERRVRETIAADQMTYADTFDRSGPIRAALLHCIDIARGGAA